MSEAVESMLNLVRELIFKANIRTFYLDVETFKVQIPEDICDEKVEEIIEILKRYPVNWWSFDLNKGLVIRILEKGG